MPKYFITAIIALILQAAVAYASSTDDGTMLMFVGEDIELLTIASRREETPARAPAVATVIRREDFLRKGRETVSRILRDVPGFHMARKEWGHKPYLRGMADSVMFLYDTVPLGSGLSKSLHPIDHELSLAPVKQVEIIRGPSSVLWGPDAFAGVVNVVPLSGRDFQGAETGVLYGEPGLQRRAYLNLGQDFGIWDGFLSVSMRRAEDIRHRANVLSFFDYDGSRPVPADERMGSKQPGDATYIDAYTKLNLGKKITLSGRYSHSYLPSIFSLDQPDIRWEEVRTLPQGYVKLDANHDLDLKTRIRISGHYSRMEPEYEIIDLTNKQADESFYAEALVDRSMFKGRGLLTAGLSYRHNKIKNAPLWDNYYPGFLVEDNNSFLPKLSTRDFENQVWSPFMQYSHKLGSFDLMLGLRHDIHQEYRNSLSYNTSLVWSPSDRWGLKFLYGTAYRTPFARQFLNKDQPEMEESENVSLQANWQPKSSLDFTGTLFYNKLSHHRNENLLAASKARANPDEYYGLSYPNTQEIYGLEIKTLLSPWPRFDFKAGLTLLDNKGSDEKYRYVKHSFTSDEEIVDVYGTMQLPFDLGPRVMLDLGADWQVTDGLSVFTEAEYFSSREKKFTADGDAEKASGVWLFHAGACLDDFLAENLDLSLSLRNITDKRYLTPGTYSMIHGRGFRGELGLRYRF